jgi:Flp pilus assembly protein TadD
MADDSVIKPIMVALQSGDLEAAERRCRVELERAPDDSALLLLLGMGLQQQNRPLEALPVFARLTELHPEDSVHWCNHATALKLAGDIEGALRSAETAVRLAPDEPERLEQLGLLKLQRGMPAAARADLLHALEIAPGSASIRIHAAQACIACRDHRADELLRPWREWLPLEHGLQTELADLLIQNSEPRDAMELLDDVVRRAPGDWLAQLLLAKVYERINRPDQAQAKLRWIVAAGAAAENPGVQREVDVQQARLALRRGEYSAARALLEKAGPGSAADDGYYFALTTVCDKLGDVAAAMRAVETAHALQIEGLRASNPDALQPGAPLLPRVDDRISPDDYRSWSALTAPDASQSPVFVVGFPRSGTTLLEQMLDAHPRLQSMDERPFMNMLASQLEDIGVNIPRDLHGLDQRDCDELRKGYVMMACGKVPRRWDARLVDKNPLNMLWLPMIQRMFPRAKFILALRHPCDVIVSCYLQNFRAASLAAACRSLQHLARSYVAAMDNWLYHSRLFGTDVFVSRHEDLVADTPAQVRRIAAFLELDNAESMLRFDARAREKEFIRTPSYTQVIEPINPRGVGHWQQYREYMQDVLPILQPMLDYWGYDIARPAGA